MCSCGEILSWQSAAGMEDPRAGGGCNVTDVVSNMSLEKDVDWKGIV